MIDLFPTGYRENYAVKDSSELRRVLALPRRQASPEDLVDALGEVLAKPGGKMRLRPVQAQALWDLGSVGGLFAPATVGAGKTLISFLAPVVCFSTRPLLIVPAKLLAKTEREKAILSAHWLIPSIRVVSYEWLGRVQGADALEKYQPDLIIADECHKLKNLRGAAVARRTNRWFKDGNKTKCVALSGTITKRSLHDYAHILQWIYGPKEYPLPVTYPEREVWADALDARKSQAVAHPGALRVFCDAEEQLLWKSDPTRAARKAYRRRPVDTPGVVATEETPIDASLVIQHLEPSVSVEVEDAFEVLRRDWETPDGWPLVDGLEMFRHARELSQGFYYRWDPRPEKMWLDPRKAWCKFVRERIKGSSKYDSELQVRQAYGDAPQWKAWEAVRGTFEPNTVPVWLDYYLVEVVEKWVAEGGGPGIVWTEHRCVGTMLEEKLGITYYGRRGTSSKGVMIEDHPPEKPLIASIQSNAEGRNLQAWNRSLVLSPPPNGAQWEQLLGRLHRAGQEADEVTYDVLMTCTEHVTAFEQARKDAEYVQDSIGLSQKLLLANISVLEIDDVMGRRQRRWAV